MDIRIVKTERAVKNAFLKLRSKKELEKITVKELCQEAQINKSTFYSHYKDIYDLSDAIEEEIVDSIIKSIMNPEYILEKPAEFAKQLFFACFAQNTMIQVLFSGKQRNHLAERLTQGVKELIFEKYPQFRNDMAKNVILTYCIRGGYYAYIENPDCDLNELVEIIAAITQRVGPLCKIQERKHDENTGRENKKEEQEEKNRKK